MQAGEDRLIQQGKNSMRLAAICASMILAPKSGFVDNQKKGMTDDR
jgi:hypothetical protein